MLTLYNSLIKEPVEGWNLLVNFNPVAARAIYYVVAYFEHVENNSVYVVFLFLTFKVTLYFM